MDLVMWALLPRPSSPTGTLPMRPLLATFLCLAGLTRSPATRGDDARSEPKPVVVASPDGRIRAEVFIEKDDEFSRVRYRVSLRDRPVVETSLLQMVLGGLDGL